MSMDERNELSKNNGYEDYEALSSQWADGFEHEEFQEMLKGLNLTDAQAAELIDTLWTILRHMVEIGYSFDICEQLFGSPTDSVIPDLNIVDFDDDEPSEPETDE